MRPTSLAFTVLLSCCAACTAPLPSVHTAVAPDAPFERYRTFSLDAPRLPEGYEATGRSDEAQRRMGPLLEAALVAKGWTLAPSDDADLVVTYGAGRRTARGTRKLSRAAVSALGETERETTFLEGALVVDVHDARTGADVFRGTATANLDAARFDERALAETVARLVDGFPARDQAGPPRSPVR